MIYRLRQVLLESETVAVRFWFGLVTIGFAAFTTQIEGHWEYEVALRMMPSWAWASLFFVNGVSLLLGVMSQRYSFLLMLVEGALGAFVWIALGAAASISQGTPGAGLVAGLVAIWILVRYPAWK